MTTVQAHLSGMFTGVLLAALLYTLFLLGSSVPVQKRAMRICYETGGTVHAVRFVTGAVICQSKPKGD